MAAQPGYIHEFAGYRLIPSEGLLLHEGKPVPLQPKAFAVLSCLVERHGHLVAKSELIEKVWNDTIVEEAAVSRCVWTIRQALGEDSKSSKFIQTIPRRGYRFVAPVTVLKAAEPRGAIQASRPPRTRPKRLLALAACIGIAVLLGGMLLALTPRNLLGGGGGSGIAILPFQPLNTGVANAPSKWGTNSEDAYRNYQQAMTLLEQQRPGSIAKAREYLDRAVEFDPDYAKAWAGKAYAYSVMWAQGPPANPENPAEVYGRSMEAATKALAIDPNLAEAYTSLCENKFAYEFNLDAAEKDCKRAIELDPRSPLAHRLYSMLLTSQGRFEESFVEIKTALELEPESVRNQLIFADDLYYARRYGEAIEVYKRLLDLNPDAVATHLYLIRSLERSGREPEALEALIRLLLLLKKDDATIQRFRAAYTLFGWRGVLNERIQTELQEKSPQYSVIAEYYGLLGDKDKAFEYLEKVSPKRHWMKMFFRVDPRFDPLHDDARFETLAKRAVGN